MRRSTRRALWLGGAIALALAFAFMAVPRNDSATEKSPAPTASMDGGAQAPALLGSAPMGMPEESHGPFGTPAPTESAETAPVVVRVVGAADEPVAGAKVTVRSETGGPRLGPLTTGADGVATFEAVPLGTATAWVECPGRGAAGVTAPVHGGSGASLRVVLPAWIPVTGRVVLPSGEGTRAIVTATRGGTVAGETESCAGTWCELARTESGEDGTFALTVPGDTIFTLEAAADTYACQGIALRRSRAADSILLRLEPGGTLRGTVRGPDGRPSPGAKVYVAPADIDDFLEEPWCMVGTDGGRYSTGTDEFEFEAMGASFGTPGPDGVATRALRAVASADGTFEVSGLRVPRTYRALAQGRDGARGASPAVTLTPQDRLGVADVSLAPRASLVVHLEDPTGARPSGEVSLVLEGAREHFLDPRGGSMYAGGLDPEGCARFGGLVAGTYQLRVNVEGRRPSAPRSSFPRAAP